MHTLMVFGGLGSALLGGAFLIAFLSLRGRGHSIKTTPADKGLAFEHVSFSSLDNTSLKGWYIPSQSNPDSDTTLILSHGFDSDRTVFLEIAPALSQAGYNLLLYDLRGNGESEGRWCSLGCLEALDVRGAVKHLKTAKPQAARHIGALGISIGAVASLIAAAQEHQIEKIIAISAFSNGTALIQRYLWIYGRVPRWLATLAIRLGERLVGVRVSRISPLPAVRHYGTRPVFFIHGGQDPLVPDAEVHKLHESVRGPKSLWVIPDAGHCLQRINATAEQYLENVLAFLKTPAARLDL